MSADEHRSTQRVFQLLCCDPPSMNSFSQDLCVSVRGRGDEAVLKLVKERDEVVAVEGPKPCEVTEFGNARYTGIAQEAAEAAVLRGPVGELLEDGQVVRAKSDKIRAVSVPEVCTARSGRVKELSSLGGGEVAGLIDDVHGLPHGVESYPRSCTRSYAYHRQPARRLEPCSQGREGEPVSKTAAPVRDLLASAEALLERPPATEETWEGRAAFVSEVALQLDEFGLDGTSLVRFGLAHLFAAPVLGSVVAALVIEAQGEELDDEVALIDLASWRRALGAPDHDGRLLGDLETVLAHANHLVEGWIAFAPLEALVRLAPFEPEQLADWAAAVDSGTRSAADVYRWLVDRTLQRELPQWSTSSLKHEYRYVTQGVASHAPTVLLEAPAPDRDALAHALAAYVLMEEDSRRDTGWGDFMQAVQKQAWMLLNQGRCLEAAALFEFLLGRYPGDPNLRNNFAFCLVTSKPEEAYECLLEAQHMGYQPKSLLLYNRACCATLDTQKRDVLFDANRHWVDGLESAPVSAYVWRTGGRGMHPAHSPDVRRDLADISVALALQLGELDRVPLWESRAAELTGERETPGVSRAAQDHLDGPPPEHSEAI